MQLSEIMCTENWSTFNNYFGSSGLLPPRFDKIPPPPFMVQKQIPSYLWKYMPKFLALNS